MVNQQELASLRAEHAALEAENAALRRRVIAAQLAGDEEALTPKKRATSPMSRVEILSREQKILNASLALAEELMMLQKSNEALFRRGQELQGRNAVLKQQSSRGIASSKPKNDAFSRPSPVSQVPLSKSSPNLLSAQSQFNTPPVQLGSIYASPPLAQPIYNNISAPLGQNYPGVMFPLVQSSVMNTAALDPAASGMPPKKCSPEEKAERRELVAQVLKAGLNQDVQTISALRPNAVQAPTVPKIKLNMSEVRKPSSPESKFRQGSGGVRGRDVSSPGTLASGAQVREPSHSNVVAEFKYLRELAIRDMLQGIQTGTPRRTPRYPGSR